MFSTFAFGNTGYWIATAYMIFTTSCVGLMLFNKDYSNATTAPRGAIKIGFAISVIVTPIPVVNAIAAFICLVTTIQKSITG